MGKIGFNVNYDIWVKLTDKGYQRLADQHNEFIGKIPNWERKFAIDYKNQADENGLTCFQLWCFLEAFGEVSGMGFPRYYETTIYLSENNLENGIPKIKFGRTNNTI